MKAFIFLAVAAVFMQAQAESNLKVVPGPQVVVIGQSYTATARFSQPLSTNHLCEGPSPSRYDYEFSNSVRLYEGSWAGYKAYEIAALSAMNACKIGFNSDCKIVAAAYQDIISMEFIGYKACEATVVVHGYRLN